MKRTQTRFSGNRRTSILILLVSMFLVTASRAGSIYPMQQQDIRNSREQRQARLEYDMTYRSYLEDPTGGPAKRIEINYRNGKLEELLVDGKSIARSEYDKYSQIVKEAELDRFRASRDMEATSVEMEKALKDIEAATIELQKVMKEFDKVREGMWKAMDGLLSDNEVKWMLSDESNPVSPEKKEKMLRRLEELENTSSARKQI